VEQEQVLALISFVVAAGTGHFRRHQELRNPHLHRRDARQLNSAGNPGCSGSGRTTRLRPRHGQVHRGRHEAAQDRHPPRQ
jgi:hypothetical protein